MRVLGPFPLCVYRGLSSPGCQGGESSHGVSVLHPSCHVANCANGCSALQPGAEPESSPLIAVALLELGTVSSIPQSHNYHHLAWVSDLEQGAAQPARPPAAGRPTTGDSFVVHSNNHDANSCHLLDACCGSDSGYRCLTCRIGPTPSPPLILSSHLPPP